MWEKQNNAVFRWVVMGMGGVCLFLFGGPRPAVAHVRLLVRNTNWYYTRHDCYIGSPSGWSGGTGMGRGATELRVGGGDIAFAHDDVMGIWPPIAYHCPSRLPSGPEVALDLTFGWVYVADGLSWTPGCTKFAQTFVAEGLELVSVRCLVASPPKAINVSLHKDSPDGPQIGAPKRLVAGTSTWGLVFWKPGEVPTEPGVRYCVVLRSADNSKWNPFVHAKGNCYDNGWAYFDDVPQPQTDLCLLISNPSDGYIRHLPVPNDARNEGQWSDVPNGQRFVARGSNLIFASIEVECGGKADEDGDDSQVYLVIRKGAPKGEQTGRKTRLWHMPGKERSIKRRGVPFGPDCVVLKPGKKYFAGLEFADGRAPGDWKNRMRLYGEQLRGSHPTVACVWTGRVFPDSIEVVWRKGNQSTAVIEYGKPGGPVLGVAVEAGQEGWAVIPSLEPDTLYQFRLIATSDQGYKYYSPWYLVRTRAKDGTLKDVKAMQSFGVFDPYFLPVADAPLTDSPKLPSRADGKKVILVNAGFESDTNGWTLSQDPDCRVSSGNEKLRPSEGDYMLGWIQMAKGQHNHGLHRKNHVAQRVSVKPGTLYELSTWAITAEPDWPRERWIEETWSFPFFGSRCRNQICLVVDTSGGEDFTGANCTQWFSTDGQWMLLKKTFRAKANGATVGAVFYQRGERDWDAAFVDDFQLVELSQ